MTSAEIDVGTVCPLKTPTFPPGTHEYDTKRHSLIEGVSKCMITGEEAQAKFRECCDVQGPHDEVYTDGSKLFPSTEVQSSCAHCLHTWHKCFNLSIMQFKFSFPPSFWITHCKQYHMHICAETERMTKRYITRSWRQNGSHLQTVFHTTFYLTENCSILIQISLNLVHKKS